MAGWTSIFQERTTSPQEAVRSIKPGHRCFLTGNCSVPQTVMKALVEYAPSVHNVEIVQVLTIGAADYVKPGMEEHLRVNTLFISANVRKAVQEGRAASVMLEAARDADMLIIGSRGHGGFTGLLLGSVSAECAEHSSCPVLVVHGPREH